MLEYILGESKKIPFKIFIGTACILRLICEELLSFDIKLSIWEHRASTSSHSLHICCNIVKITRNEEVGTEQKEPGREAWREALLADDHGGPEQSCGSVTFMLGRGSRHWAALPARMSLKPSSILWGPDCSVCFMGSVGEELAQCELQRKNVVQTG